MTALALRPADPADVQTLFAIRCSVRENHQSREELADLGLTPASVAAMIADRDYITTLVTSPNPPGDRVLGFTMARISEGYILACFVRPEAQGQGVGRAAMAAAESGLAQAGVGWAWLSTGPGETLRAPGFYHHLGWREDGRLADGQIRFVKDLSPLALGRLPKA